MKVFSEVLDKIDRKLKRMAEQLETTRWLADAGQFGAAYEHAMHLEDTAERLTLLTRVLPCYTGAGPTPGWRWRRLSLPRTR